MKMAGACLLAGRRCAPPRTSSSGVELVRSIPARYLVGAGENGGEGVDENVGDALAFECCEERVRIAPLEAHGCTRKD
jgi:hypothetical protein